MIETLSRVAESRGLDALMISAPDNVEYLTGVSTVADSTLLMVYCRGEETAYLYVPLLEYYRYRDLSPPNVVVRAVAKPIDVLPSDVLAVNKDWSDIISEYRGSKKIGADLSHKNPLGRTIEGVLPEKVVDVSDELWRARAIKSSRELESIAEATKITLRGILCVYTEMHDNVTEAMLAGIFEKTIRDHGAEGSAFEPIVAFKPNNAYPHTMPGQRALKRGDLVLIDVGAKFKGRCSDVTRMITYRRPEPEERKSIEVAIEAAYSAIDAIMPGIKTGEVHQAATKVLEKHGLKERFIHGLGHGVGVVVHEPPYIRANSSAVLEPGMVFTVEPGIYFPGKYGVRVEELVLLTRKGPRILSKRLECALSAL
ncbi:MAG: Xaa-Pro peptidase family protein [Desulfurococcaceae archaeon]